jgi:hypothetical protein
MPRVQENQALAELADKFGSHIGYAAAARLFGVSRATFYRFCKTGKAVAETRERIRAGLGRQESEGLSDPETPIGAVDGKIRSPGELRVQDLHQLRRICESVLQVLDVLESRPPPPQAPAA